MSRIRIFGASLIATAFGTGAAIAADIAVYAPPAPEAVYSPAPAYSWTGPYVGGILGYGWGSADGAGANRAADGIAGGIYGGYNWQAGPGFVLGAEADITATGMEGKGGGETVSNPWNGTLRGRAGVTMDRFMLYGTGGLSVGEVSVKNTPGGGTASKTQAGWTLGAGVEALLTSNVTGRVEYRYTDYGSDKYKGDTIDFNSSQVFVGVGLKY